MKHAAVAAILFAGSALTASCSRAGFELRLDATTGSDSAMGSDGEPDDSSNQGADGAQPGDCSTNDECPQVCVHGACATRGASGDTCDPGEDDDCVSGVICVAGTCRDDPCSAPGVGADVDGRCVRTCPPPQPQNGDGDVFYLASSGGLDTNPGTSPAGAWATFAHAWGELKAGDTLILLDGVYTSSLAPTVSGDPGAPITIRAANDGKAIIDGQSRRQACQFVNVSHLVVEGIQCRNHGTSIVNSGLLFISRSNDVTARRVTVFRSNDQSPLVHVYRSDNVLIEDVAAWGPSDRVFVSYESDHVTFRRCWAELPEVGPDSGPVSGVALNQSSNSLVENCVTIVPNAAPRYEPKGFTVSGGPNNPSNGNRLLGNIVRDLGSDWSYMVHSMAVRIENNSLINNVSIDGGFGIYQRADANLLVDRHTAVGTDQVCLELRALSPGVYDEDFAIHGMLTHSVFWGGALGLQLAEAEGILPTFTHDYNVLFGLDRTYGAGVSAAPHEMTETLPQYDTATFGDGAYLIAPANLAAAGAAGGPVGAEVLYRYQDGQLTCVPLWPWPMEQRILSERGVGVTWETTSGLWRTLDNVYP